LFEAEGYLRLVNNMCLKTIEKLGCSNLLRLIALAGMLWPSVVSADDISFNRDIRPILSENCFYCHGQDPNKRESGLRLDVRKEAIDYGAITPNDVEVSTLIERVLSDDQDTMMPPPESNRKISNSQKELLKRWVQQGAKYQSHWAFVSPTRPELPKVKQSDWPKNPIDQFVLAKLKQTGLAPSPQANRETLIRRLHADLTGLPPTPEEVEAFVSNQNADAYDNLVDRLLASPHYGERMAMPWLDAARYADSNGFQQDGDTWQWVWRDWVVDAFNADMPFDQFSIEQLAGDLLPDASVSQKIATAFNRNHLLNGEGGAIAEEQRFNNLFDRVDTTSTTWLGLTMACAQCHDHKYDPLTQKDYYRLMHIFNQVPEKGRPGKQSSRIRVAEPFIRIPGAKEEQQAKLKETMQALEKQSKPLMEAAYRDWKNDVLADEESIGKAELPKELIALLKKPPAKRTEKNKKAIEDQIRKHFEAQIKKELGQKIEPVRKYYAAKKAYNDYVANEIPHVMVMSDDRYRETKVLDRGEYLSPIGEPLSFATPGVLPSLPDDLDANRLGLAKWLFLAENPLTARVQVNRMWQFFFGIGIVKTSEDMGVQSEYPQHMELLDWLAIEFQESGWSMKTMHRMIVTSATYRQSSRVTAEHLVKDPENRLHARASRFRMPSMILRDVALAASGLLNTKVGGKPVYPYQPDAIWESLAITKERDFTYPTSKGPDLYRRSLYTFWRRTVAPANMFDVANRRICVVRTGLTCTPLHALTTLNDPTWTEAARVLAEVCIQTETKIEDQLTLAFRRVVARKPTENDLKSLRKMYDRQLAVYEADEKAATQLISVGESPRDEKLDPVKHAALSNVCLGIFNLDEALNRE